MIKARAYTDDHAIEVDFDALPYFQQADPQTLEALIRCNFEHDLPADHVARGLTDQNSDLQRMFTYLDTRNNGSGGQVGFEVTIDEDQAYEWLAANRPEALDKAGVDLADFDLGKCEQCGAIRDRDDLSKASKKAPMLCASCDGERITWSVTRNGNTLELPHAVDTSETGVVGFIDGPSNDKAWYAAWVGRDLEVKEEDGQELVRPAGSDAAWTPLYRTGNA